ncbi:SPOR domain-containing protein [Halomonas sp. EGI 63088]|uniref:SPOR domain-containing protein n=1 Tax=Halomonas flagellata TaxID=2920385 RepID=A0ABS9RQ70_9GAMM|nr:SPOR domain-containing protein [Halomonas flagellata]MCH4561981.1 SPOR domain-containing protein [Halomonas flagellata]
MARRPAPKKRGATSSKRRSTPRTSHGLPGWLWGLAGLTAGFLLAQHQHGTAPWQEGSDSPLATVVPRTPSAGDEAAQRPQASSAPEEPRMPTFEFYTLLPESEVVAPRGEVPASTARPPAPASEPEPEAANAPADDPIAQVIAANLRPRENATADPAPSPANGHRYMLQAASFRESGDAQQLQQRLRNLSLVAQVSQVQASGGETWHRVQVGPFDDNRELNRAQDLMVTQGIDPLLIRLQN